MFTESNTVQDLIADTLSKMGWTDIHPDNLNRDINQVLLESNLRDALIRLNPEIEANPDRADEVFYKLRAIIQGVDSDGVVKANEDFTSWLKGEKSMPFGENNQHTTVRLIDFHDLENNEYLISKEVSFQARETKRFDLVCYINGIPLIVGEMKTPVRDSITWFDGAIQIHDNYVGTVPAFFVPNLFSFASDGREYKYGTISMGADIWFPWGESGSEDRLSSVEDSIKSMFRPEIILDILNHFTVFGTDKGYSKSKLICRHQQYEGANMVVERVVKGHIKKGLIWHFQGSGKSLLMVFAAQKLRLHSALNNPTVLVVVDRVDLDTQITSTFNMVEAPNMVTTDSRKELENLLERDARKIIITTIFKFKEAEGVLNERENIIVLVDEAHRTQEGDLGQKMRDALPNAFLFGLTGTPINKIDRNTYKTFGAREDKNRYMSRYTFQQSIRDNATLKLHFDPRPERLRIDKDAIEEGFGHITEGLEEGDRARLSTRAGRFSTLVKAEKRVNDVVQDMVTHFEEKVEPNGFKAMIVAMDREACVLYKEAMDHIIDPERSAIVMTLAQNDPPDWKRNYGLSKDEEEKLLGRFRSPNHPLQFLIVTAKLLTGFDAPILQTMYLDKLMKDHTLLQAICRTNRPYEGKTHGLIVDYLGIFENVTKYLAFDEESIRTIISNIDELKNLFPSRLARCLAFFPEVDRSVTGYEVLMAAQNCLPDNKTRDKFAGQFSELSKMWEAISPDRFLNDYREDYKWLSQVYESVKPASANGRLLWHALGAKTLDLVNQNIEILGVKDELDELILDEEFLSNLEGDVPKNIVKVNIQIGARLRKHKNDPRFIELGERLERLRLKHEQGMIESIDLLRDLLEIARDVVELEKDVDAIEDIDQGKSALTDLFEEVKNDGTPIIVENIVNDIDEIVRHVKFLDWQHTRRGERDVKKALRKTLLKYKLHKEQDLFDKAYSYIKQYY